MKQTESKELFEDTPPHEILKLKDDETVYHPFTGLCSGKYLKGLVISKIMVFNRIWRVPTESSMDFAFKKGGELKPKPSAVFRRWANSRKTFASVGAQSETA